MAVTVVYIKEGHQVCKVFPKYKEVKRKMNAFMNDSFDENVSVFRMRRGQWGEWFENWSRIGGKAKIIREGWQ